MLEEAPVLRKTALVLLRCKNFYQCYECNQQPNGIKHPTGMRFFENSINDEKETANDVQQQVLNGLTADHVQTI